MDTQTRHALKQDRFVEATATGLDWLQTNRTNFIKVAAAVVVLVALVITGVVVYNSRTEHATVAFGEAMDIYSAPIRQPGQPAIPNDLSYASAAERAKAANPLFLKIASEYSWLKAGANAEYFAGLTYLDMGQTGSAEAELQKAAGSHDKGLAALAKMALAGVYVQTNRTNQAVDIYKELSKNPTVTVPAAAAQLQLAQLYETTNPAEAKRIYAEIKDKDKGTAAAQIASQKLAGGK